MVNKLIRKIMQGSAQPVILEKYNDKIDRAVAINRSNPLPISLGDTPSIDAFARLRVSNPQTLFDSKNVFDDPGIANTLENLPQFYDNQETSGGGTNTAFLPNEASQTLSVSLNTAGTRVRQTKMRFNYQPGKSQLIFMTFNANGALNNGITKREGLFDENNGIFLELNGTTPRVVRRTNVTGTPVDNPVNQADWNLDKLNGSGPSGININFAREQLFTIDMEWLGTGRIRTGFFFQGMIVYCHEFLNANILSTVHLSTPNLPLRAEISNDGTGAADSIKQTCSTVISEGGSQDLGMVRYASTNGTHVDMATQDVIYAIIGIRLKAAYIGESIKILNAAIQLQTGGHQVEWILKLNPAVADTFAYADEINSAVQIARGGALNVVTGGIDITGGFLESGGQQAGNAGSGSEGINNAILLGSLIDGTVDEIVLCARPIGGSTAVDVEGALDWREIS